MIHKRIATEKEFFSTLEKYHGELYKGHMSPDHFLEEVLCEHPEEALDILHTCNRIDALLKAHDGGWEVVMLELPEVSEVYIDLISPRTD